MDDDQQTRQRRAARNQSLFREVNERIEALQRSTNQVEFVCECCDRECVEHVPLTIDEYESIRSEPNSFFVLRGHEKHDIEGVIREGDRYLVVAKSGAGAPVAEALDPRA
jgi:uncharacterized Zn finger protein